MKVVNNKIYITRGETTTYNLNLKYLDDDSPFRLVDDTGELDFIAVLTIKSTVYETKPATKQMVMNLNSIKPIFTSNDWIDKSTLVFGGIENPQTGVLYKAKKLITDETAVFGYYTGTEWVTDYTFTLNFPFTYDITAKLESKKYVYDVNIFWGNWVAQDSDEMNEFNVLGKQIIIEPTELQVGGSLSG